MSLTAEQEKIIIEMDVTANRLLQQGGEEALLASLGNHMSTLKSIMDTVSSVELDRCCEKYNGFYQYMQVLEKLAHYVSKP